MLRSILNSCSQFTNLAFALPRSSLLSVYNACNPQYTRCFSAVASASISPGISGTSCNGRNHRLIPVSATNQHQHSPLILPSPLILHQQSRSVVKFSFSRGKRRTVKVVLNRFKRLDWGIWIRRIGGAHKSLWRKTNKRRMRLERHVLVNSTRSYMLDKMVSVYWRTPKYWVNDPYAPYHKREEFNMTNQKPRPLPPGVTFTRES